MQVNEQNLGRGNVVAPWIPRPELAAPLPVKLCQQYDMAVNISLGGLTVSRYNTWAERVSGKPRPLYLLRGLGFRYPCSGTLVAEHGWMAAEKGPVDAKQPGLNQRGDRAFPEEGNGASSSHTPGSTAGDRLALPKCHHSSRFRPDRALKGKPISRIAVSCNVPGFLCFSGGPAEDERGNPGVGTCQSAGRSRRFHERGCNISETGTMYSCQ